MKWPRSPQGCLRCGAARHVVYPRPPGVCLRAAAACKQASAAPSAATVPQKRLNGSDVATIEAHHDGVLSMSAAKQEVQELLDKLPDDCTLEDVQYHLYVIEKVQRGIEAAKEHGTVSQDKAEQRLARWTTQ